MREKAIVWWARFDELRERFDGLRVARWWWCHVAYLVSLELGEHDQEPLEVDEVSEARDPKEVDGVRREALRREGCGGRREGCGGRREGCGG